MPKRLKSGDVFQVITPQGKAYIQFCSKHLEYGEMIRVLPGIFPEQPDISGLIDKHAYFTFYPLALSAFRKMVDLVGNFPLLESYGVAPILRRAGAMLADGTVKAWIIEDPVKGDTLREILNDSERQLSLAEIWNHEMLVGRIETQWRPDLES